MPAGAATQEPISIKVNCHWPIGQAPDKVAEFLASEVRDASSSRA